MKEKYIDADLEDRVIQLERIAAELAFTVRSVARLLPFEQYAEIVDRLTTVREGLSQTTNIRE